MMARLRDELLIPVLAILMGLVVGAVLMVVTSPLIDGQLEFDLPL
jgi:ABC-type uncharacterized transport system permease subunit